MKIAKNRSLILATVLLLIGSLQLVSAASEMQVTTDSGSYQGYSSEYAEGVTVFQGLAYAAPPVRDLRWKPPAPTIPFAGYD